MSDLRSANLSGDAHEDTEPDQLRKKLDAKRRKAKRSALQKLAKCVGPHGLFESCLLVLVDNPGRVQTFSNSPGWRKHFSSEDKLRSLLAKRRKKMTEEQKLANIAVYGEPPSPQHAFDVMNANACENLLRVMKFSKLRQQDIPAHMQKLKGSYIHLGKFLDQAHRGKIDGNKFEGHDKKDGRFKAQVFKEHELCRLDAWVHGECPEGPEYVTFEDLLNKPIAQMTKPMKVAAIFVMLEWANPGTNIFVFYIHMCAT